MKLRFFLTAALGLSFVPMAANAQITTGFNTGDGFTTGAFAPVTLSDTSTPAFTATFSGGQQAQGFDGPSYEAGPAGYLFVNGTFTGTSGNSISGDGVGDDLGLIDFSGPGAGSVSFFGANRGFGPSVGVTVFGLDDSTVLNTFSITQTALNGSPVQTVLTEAAVGGAIGSIQFDLPGPAANPPYVAAIDTFSATASTTAVPEPSSALGLGLMGLCYALRRRKK